MDHALATEDKLKILSLKGDIDLHQSPGLRAILQDLIKERCPALVIDFKEVGYIDSSGLATLVEYYQGCRSYSGEVALAELNQRVQSVFDLVRLGEVFKIHKSLEEAKASILPG
ncbi:MAG: STAS domain-containing protein [Verrucomicrobiota bacterium]